MYHRGEEMSGGRMRKRRVKFQVYLFFWVDFASFLLNKLIEYRYSERALLFNQYLLTTYR